LSPITFVLLSAASGALDELQAAASGMTVGKQEFFSSDAEIGDILAHAARRSTVWSQFVDQPEVQADTFSCRGCSIRRISDMRFKSMSALSRNLHVTLILDLMHVLEKLWKAAYVFLLTLVGVVKLGILKP
jgi:hypothetical protein